MDTNGQIMAVGLAMPGLSQTLDIQDQGTNGLNQALSKVSEGQKGMTALSSATASAGDGISQTLSQVRSALYSKLDLVQALAEYTDTQGAFCGSAEGMADLSNSNSEEGNSAASSTDTTTIMMATVGLGNPPEITVLLNQGKNPTVSNAIQTTLSSVFLQAGIVANMETYNAYDMGGGTMGSLMMVQMLVMPLLLSCMVPSIILSLVAWPRKATITKKERTSEKASCTVGIFSGAVRRCHMSCSLH